MSFLSGILDKARGLGLSFYVMVVFPTISALVYFGLIASDVYISESKFVIRDPTRQPNVGLSLLLNATRYSNFGDEASAVRTYIGSRDAMLAVNKNGLIRRTYTLPSISMFDRFGAPFDGNSDEELYRYFSKKVKVDHDTATSVATLTVRAYRSADAQTINRQLLERSEDLVNHLSSRGRRDLVEFAEAELRNAQIKSQDAARNLAAYRDRAGVVDPEKQAAITLQMISKLQDQLIASRTQVAQLRAITPRNPQIPVLEKQINELSRSIERESATVAGGTRSLAATAERYQRLLIESQVADKQLAGAIAGLQDARSEALRKQAYVERIAQPNLPDHSFEPRRTRGILATLVVGLIAWGIFRLLAAGIREHMG